MSYCDVAGHYSRPDILLQLLVNRRPLERVIDRPHPAAPARAEVDVAADGALGASSTATDERQDEYRLRR